MSGIINSAGSRSGVIGTTEIDYEEGTWAPSVNEMGSSVGRYVKIGKMVFCNGWINFATYVNPRVLWSGLPFTAVAYGFDYGGGGVAVYNTNENSPIVRVLRNTKTFHFILSAASVNMQGAGDIAFALTYEVV